MSKAISAVRNMQPAFISFDLIKLTYPSEWVLPGNPQMQDTTILGGVVVYHSKDKKEVCYIGRDKTAEFDTVTIDYTGTAPQGRRVGVLKRFTALSPAV